MTVNNPGNPEIHISEEKLQKFGLVLLGIAVLFTIIGAMVSPLDDQGKPVLLLPEVKEVEDYRRSAQTLDFRVDCSGWGDCACYRCANNRVICFHNPDLPSKLSNML